MQTPVMFPEDKLRIDVTHFDFVSQLASLLKDKSLTGDLTQLDVPPNNPFAKYKSPNGHLGTFNSGSWYDKAWDYVCEPNSNDWMCTIIYGCDETIVGSSQGCASVTPLLFTLSIFNEHIRNKRTSWRPLGYVYDFAQHGKGTIFADTTTPRELKPEEKISRYHRMMRSLETCKAATSIVVARLDTAKISLVSAGNATSLVTSRATPLSNVA
jgi:hypothetical protein